MCLRRKTKKIVFTISNIITIFIIIKKLTRKDVKDIYYTIFTRAKKFFVTFENKLYCYWLRMTSMKTLTKKQKEDREYWDKNQQDDSKLSKRPCSFPQEEDDPFENLKKFHQNSTQASERLRSFLQKEGVPEDIIEWLMCFLTRIATQKTVDNEHRLYHKCLLEQTTILLKALIEVQKYVLDNVLAIVPTLSKRHVPLARFLFSCILANFVQRLAKDFELDFLTEASTETLGLFQRSFTRILRANKPITLSEEILKSFPSLVPAEKLFLLICIKLLGASFGLTTKQLNCSGLKLLELDAKSWFSISGVTSYWSGGDSFFFKKRRDGSVRATRGRISQNKFYENKKNILDLVKLLEEMSLGVETSRAERKRESSVEKEHKHDSDEDSGDDGLKEFTVSNKFNHLEESSGIPNLPSKKVKSTQTPRPRRRPRPRAPRTKIYPNTDPDSDSGSGTEECTVS